MRASGLAQTEETVSAVPGPRQKRMTGPDANSASRESSVPKKPKPQTVPAGTIVQKAPAPTVRFSGSDR